MSEYYRVQYANGQHSDGITDPSVQWDQYLLPRRVDGLKVYDYGTWDGGLAIEAARRGAAEVWGLDAFVWEMCSPTRTNFERNVAMSGMNVMDAYVQTEPVPQRRWNATSRANPNKLTIKEFAAKHGQADLVIAGGVFYHLQNPLLFLEFDFSPQADQPPASDNVLPSRPAGTDHAIFSWLAGRRHQLLACVGVVCHRNVGKHWSARAGDTPPRWGNC